MEFVDLPSGKTVAGEPIKAYKTPSKSDHYIYLIAGTHGDEVEGVYVLDQLFEWLRNDSEANIDLPLVVIPILNNDGYRAATRVNANGVDLNRNYPSKSWSAEFTEDKYKPGNAPLSEPENLYFDGLLKSHPPKIILSFHSWKPMINYNGDCKSVAEFLFNYNNYPICDDIEGYPTPGSLGDYAPENYKSPVITFECPLLDEKVTLKSIWEENKEGLQKLLQSDLLK